MRTIEYRGIKIGEPGCAVEWVYGDLIHLNGNNVGILPIESMLLTDVTVVWSTSVGQFLGFEDKKNKPVYEGDIDDSHHRGKRVIVYDATQGGFVLAWLEHYEKWKQKGITEAGITWQRVTPAKKLNIIGNIHQR